MMICENALYWLPVIILFSKQGRGSKPQKDTLLITEPYFMFQGSKRQSTGNSFARMRACETNTCPVIRNNVNEDSLEQTQYSLLAVVFSLGGLGTTVVFP
ncbi:hypothetical protein TNCV_4131181 [Trichonephila clavipes]|nr:hypothetical protein TNCV_4131181 [Trichonephila clavipes]